MGPILHVTLLSQVLSITTWYQYEFLHLWSPRALHMLLRCCPLMLHVNIKYVAGVELKRYNNVWYHDDPSCFTLNPCTTQQLTYNKHSLWNLTFCKLTNSFFLQKLTADQFLTAPTLFRPPNSNICFNCKKTTQGALQRLFESNHRRTEQNWSTKSYTASTVNPSMCCFFADNMPKTFVWFVQMCWAPQT